jgi:Pro-kumamolisin, activation domain/Divergent InlB B-repeat domain/Subtilase family
MKFQPLSLSSWSGLRLSRRCRPVKVIFLVLLSLAWVNHFAIAQQMVAVPQTPRTVQNGDAQLIEHCNPQQKLRLVFTLKPPHMVEEEQFLDQLQDRDSPLFHQYLSPEEWNQRFAPSVEDEQSVVSWAQSQGLTITQRYPNRLLVDVEAPVATIERALDVSINRYQLGGKRFYSNDRDPSLPAQLAGTVRSVLGLNSLEVMHTASRKNERMVYPDYVPGPAYAVGGHLQGEGDASREKAGQVVPGKTGIYYSAGGKDPVDIYDSSAYDYQALQNLGHCCNPLNNPSNSPPEASIAIAIWEDFSDSDFNGFISWETINLHTPLAYDVQRYFVDGTPRCCGGEPTLDVEWATAMANSFDTPADTAEIHAYEGADNKFSTLLDVVNRALTDGHARVLSMSWGAAEIYETPSSVMNSYHAVFNQMAGQGWTLVAASGDGGATTDCADHLSVSYPASDPDVTAAGGTFLQASYGYYYYEEGWVGGPYGCAKNDGGGGGGCSAYFSAPGYQTSPACGAHSRSLPDIALNADWFYAPQNIYFNGYMQGNGGTSIVAPEMAGLYAQENAYLLYLGSIVGNTCGSNLSAPCAPLGNANWYLYYEGLHPRFAPHYAFYDILSGCNGNDITQKYGLTFFCAAKGYDQVTGWGSANMLQLAWMMNAFVAGDSAGPAVTISGALRNHWYNTNQTLNWTAADRSRNGHLPNGVVGSSYYWGSDPGDPYSEPTPGTAWYPNSFYSGPAILGSDGSTDLDTGNGGCQNLIVRAWDNAGQASTTSYGPLCYDAWPPYTYATLTGVLQGQYYAGLVIVTLNPTDNLSGVASTWYEIDGGAWQRYLRPIHVAAPGIYTVGFYSKDVAGNIENIEYANFIIAYNNQQDTLSVSKTGTGSGTVAATDGGINCGALCSNSYYDGSEVTLTVTPSPGSVFAGWSGTCDFMDSDNCIVDLASNRGVTATFNHAVALRFVPVTPCRIADTRDPDGEFGGPPIQGGTHRDFIIPDQTACGIPKTAAAYSLNVTVVPFKTLGYLTVWPTGQTQPVLSTLNSIDGRVKANAAIVPAGSGEAVSVYATDTTNLVLDIDGYFVADSSKLAFFPLPPCRVADTRNPNGPLGGPYLQGKVERDFPVLDATACNIPSAAQAYSLNFTVVPHKSLGYLSVWPAGQDQPVVSTLNAPTGTVTANAAMVPAGAGGSLAVYPTDDTDLVIDINGYFAPANSGPNPLSLYALLPCRVLDTRLVDGPFSGQLTPPTDVAGSFCAVPSANGAYVLNATVVPLELLGYLTLWPDGQGQPLVSTLNAIDGAVTSNMAIVPSTNGKIDAYADGTTNLIVDIFSYFAP